MHLQNILRQNISKPCTLSLSLSLSSRIPGRNMVYRERRRRRQPCLHCHPQGYIRMVQHLIERCLVFHMTRDDCIQALAKHASVQPVVTLTVWKELLKENESFFQAYYRVVPQSHPEYKPSERISKGTKQKAMEVKN